MLTACVACPGTCLLYHLFITWWSAFVRFSLAKAGQPLSDHVRPAVRGMTVLRYGVAKQGLPLVARVRRVPMGMSLFRFEQAKAG